MVEPSDLDIEYLATLSKEELEKRLSDWNGKASLSYLANEVEAAEEYATAAYCAYIAMQRKKGIILDPNKPITRADARRILDTK